MGSVKSRAPLDRCTGRAKEEDGKQRRQGHRWQLLAAPARLRQFVLPCGRPAAPPALGANRPQPNRRVCFASAPRFMPARLTRACAERVLGGFANETPCRPIQCMDRRQWEQERARQRGGAGGPGEQRRLGFFPQHVPAGAVEGGCERLLLQRTKEALDRGPAVLAANACIAAEFAGAGRASHGIEKLFRRAAELL